MPIIPQTLYQRSEKLLAGKQHVQDAPTHGTAIEDVIPVVSQGKDETRESCPLNKQSVLDVDALSPSEQKRLDIAVNLLLDFLLEHRKQ